MSQSEKKSTAAAGAKTARPCDICLRWRARWYCAADDAFLCQSCDSTVHSANYVARRHERLRLRTSSTFESYHDEPTWHHGFRRKARTPRGGAKGARTDTVVPELETGSEEEGSAGGEEEQLLYRVPIFLSEFCSPPVDYDDVKPARQLDGPAVFLPAEMDMGEFEMDMESLLGGGMEEESFCMEALGLMGSPEEGGSDVGCSAAECYKERVKQEEEEEGEMYCNDLVDVNFDCGTPWMEEDKNGRVAAAAECGEEKKRRITLRLDYKAVMAEWATQGSPWTNGERPQLGSGDCLTDYMGLTWVGGGGGDMHSGVSSGGSRISGGGGGGGGDGGREAKVSRYREKRRTRLFSKKIRYEVRKLNAEKRPRMKGRFVKRTTFVAAGNAPVAPAQFAF